METIKKITLIVLIHLFAVTVVSAQNAGDKMCYDNLFFYGNSLVLNGHHLSVRKARKMMKNVSEAQVHFKNIVRIRLSAYPIAIVSGGLIGVGIAEVRNNGLQFTNSVLLPCGLGTIVSLYEHTRLEKSEMEQIAEIYNKNLRK